ncbi:glycosyltransferase [Puniceicoccaceae bacterium K14]|nr:glycosyltransferase [Puniceicoccaceae bacterium K14]
MNTNEVTTIICARDAEGTIARAVLSAAAEGGPVIVVDDFSSDETASIALKAGGEAVSVIRPTEHRTLGYARSTGVAAVETPWLIWLDADDAFLPGRIVSLLNDAESNQWDAVWDAVDLYDGETENFIRRLPMPDFMSEPGYAVRLFERNWVPSPAWPLVKTEFAKRIGYDESLPTADDIDFMLRSVVHGARLGFVESVGYKQFAYPSSLSRDLSHQRNWLAHVLRKFDYKEIKRLYSRTGFDSLETVWALVTVALFRREAEGALDFMRVLPPLIKGEGRGLWGLSDEWRRAFQRGTCLLILAEDLALAEKELARADSMERTPEALNNWGVALDRLGEKKKALECWRMALEMLPSYLDARLNIEANKGVRITEIPLRRLASRSEY